MTVLNKWKMAKVYIFCNVDGTDGIVSTRCVPCVRNVPSRFCYGNVAGWFWTCFNELFVTAHIDDILNTDSNK